MDPQRSHKAKRKGKGKMPEGADPQAKNTKRGDNWTAHETSNLINAIDQVQIRRGRKGFSFTSTENHEIYTFFMAGIPDSRRDKDKIINRIKVVLKMFRICDELSKRSGGGWDDATHRPIAPSEKEYEDMVRAKGEPGRFLLKSNFPWFRKLESMGGGQSAEGGRTSENWNANGPIHFLLDSQMSIHVSSQGSSDDPDEDSVRSTDRQRASQSSVPTSGNSGSKRKSPHSTEPNVRGKKYKERYKKKQSDVKELADVGRCIAAAMTANSAEESASLQKLEEVDMTEEEHDFLFNLLENSSYKRKWFLQNQTDEILRFVRKELRRKATENVSGPNPTAYTAPNHGFPQPNPAANAAYSQFYPPPNPAASTFFYRPGHPNRDGNFM